MPSRWPRTIQYSLEHPTNCEASGQTADRFPDAAAIIYNHKQWTYRELLAQVNRMAGGFARLGVRKNERVVMTLPNCPEFVIIFFALQKLGAVPVNAGPLNSRRRKACDADRLEHSSGMVSSFKVTVSSLP